MVEYVYALHDFYPEHEDEISFNAAERIEVIEKDDQYGDGWWQGRNLSGQAGLFPQSYTTPAPPSVDPSIPSPSAAVSAFANATSSPKVQLQTLREESESGASRLPTPGAGPSSLRLNGHDSNAVSSKTNINGDTNAESTKNGDYIPDDGEVMKATMTDVQKAIEQLGRSKHDPDGTRSFSFASTRDGDRDTENETETDTDFEVDPDKDPKTDKGENWHKGARRKLAEKARRAVEEAEKLEMMMSEFGSVRSAAPPIEVELSDESEGEDGDHPHRIKNYEMGRQHSYIPEEDEDAEEDESNHVVEEDLPKSTGQQRADLTDAVEAPMQDSTDLPTAKAVQSSFPDSSGPTSSASQEPVIENDKLTPIPSSLPTSLDLGRTKTTPALLLLAKQEASPSSHVADLKIRAPITSSEMAIVPQPQLRSDSQIAAPVPQFNQPQHSPAPLSTPTSTLIGQQDTSTIAASEMGKTEGKEKSHPTDWSVEEVVEWLKGKGFGQDVCEKFIEQEITGDVLLELDASLLKTEMGIMAFGKRVRITNAIAELRRPPSVTYSDHHPSPRSPVPPNPFIPPVRSPNHSRTQSQTPSQSYSFTHTQSMSSSTHHSLQGPVNLGSPGYALLSPESAPHTGDIVGSPTLSSFAAFQATNGDYTNRETEKQTISEGSFTTDERGTVGLGIATPASQGDKLVKSRPAQLTISPSDTALHKTTQAISDSPEDGEDDRGVLSEGEAPQMSTTTSMRRRLFGRSRDSTESGKGKDKRVSDPSNSKLKDFSPKTSPTKDTDRDGSSSVTSRHSRGKKSIDNGKPSDRLSLFGSTFSGPLGRSRKPPPKYSASTAETLDSQTEKGSNLSISRLYGQKKPSIRGRNSERSSIDNKDKTKASPTTRAFKSKDAEAILEKEREATVLRKRWSPGSPTAAATAAIGELVDMDPALDQLEPGRSIMEQVGEPDYSGWMRKKGDRYNSWKMRYFILKGPHLYCLRSNNQAETKIKGYINIMGYKVVADENANPGRYAFKIIHELDKTHFFSSDEQIVIREWMKAIMKATIGRDYTKPVVSSCNIPTIPLVVAQAMNPAPRPPSPSARDATQKALRRQNPNQLSSRDARVLMGLPAPPSELKEHERLRLESFFVGEPLSNFNVNDISQPPVLPPLLLSTPTTPAPPRPARERVARKVTSRDELSLTAADRSLIEWANSHLPSALRINETRNPLCGGLTLLRLAESIRGRPSSPPVPDSAFPTDLKDDKLDGLFKLFDFLLDNDVKMGAVSINDVRHGKRDKILQLLRALKAWEDKRRAVAQSIGKGPGQHKSLGLDLT